MDKVKEEIYFLQQNKEYFEKLANKNQEKCDKLTEELKQNYDKNRFYYKYAEYYFLFKVVLYSITSTSAFFLLCKIFIDLYKSPDLEKIEILLSFLTSSIIIGLCIKFKKWAHTDLRTAYREDLEQRMEIKEKEKKLNEQLVQSDI